MLGKVNFTFKKCSNMFGLFEHMVNRDVQTVLTTNIKETFIFD